MIALLAGIFMLCMGVACSSKSDFETASELSQYWSETGYPSYICGVFVWNQFPDKMVVAFGITDDEAGKAGQEEILALIEDKSTIHFVTQKYTYAQMLSVKENLISYLTSHYEMLGEWNVGIRQSKNYVYVNLWENEKNLDVIERFKNEVYEKYGDMIYIAVSETEGGLSLD